MLTRAEMGHRLGFFPVAPSKAEHAHTARGTGRGRAVVFTKASHVGFENDQFNGLGLEDGEYCHACASVGVLHVDGVFTSGQVRDGGGGFAVIPVEGVVAVTAVYSEIHLTIVHAVTTRRGHVGFEYQGFGFGNAEGGGGETAVGVGNLYRVGAGVQVVDFKSGGIVAPGDRVKAHTAFGVHISRTEGLAARNVERGQVGLDGLRLFHRGGFLADAAVGVRCGNGIVTCTNVFQKESVLAVVPHEGRFTGASGGRGLHAAVGQAVAGHILFEDTHIQCGGFFYSGGHLGLAAVAIGDGGGVGACGQLGGQGATITAGPAQSVVAIAACRGGLDAA